MEKNECYRVLKQLIIEQKYRPEQMLNEKDLMQTFDIGRTPLREVLLDLQREGLVNVIPRCGTFVSSLSLDDLKNISQLRPTLESLVVGLLCDNATQEQLDHMANILQEAEKIIDANGGERLCSEAVVAIRNLEANLHNYMYEATSNPYLIYICRPLEANCERYWVYANLNTDWLISQIEDHKNLYQAIQRRDREVSMSIAKDHATRFIQRVIASLTKIQ